MTHYTRRFPRRVGSTRMGSWRFGFSALAVLCLCLGVTGSASAWWYLANAGGTVYSVAVDGSGDVVAAGEIDEVTGPIVFTVAKVSGTTGAELWRQELVGGAEPENNGARAVAVDGSGDVVAAGELQNVAWATDFTVVKFSGATGAELWRQEITGTADGSAEARSVAIDGAGDVVAAGWVENTTSQGDFTVVKFSGATGAVLWRQEINGTANGLDRALSLAIDTSGDVVAAGRVENTTSQEDFTVVKLSGATGAELWRREIDGTASRWDEATSVAVDGAGDVVAVGWVENATSGFAFTVVKLSGATGVELWRDMLDGTANNLPLADAANTVTIDAFGNVIAAGHLTEDVPHGRPATVATVVKFSGPTGTELWRYSQAGGSAESVTVDGVGNVLAQVPYALGTVKLSGATGNPLWHQELQGAPGGWDSSGRAVTVDSSGDAILAGTLASNFAVVKLPGATGLFAEPAGGKRLVVTDHASKPERRAIKLKSSHPGPFVGPGRTNDPTAVGAEFRVVNPVTAESAVLALPAGHWRARRNPHDQDSVVYLYRDPSGADGPCIQARLKASSKAATLVARCLGKRGTIPFTLDEPSQGELAVALRLGPLVEYCARFGGTVVQDSGTASPGPKGVFKAKNADPPVGPCPEP